MEANVPNKIYLSPKSFEIGEKFNGILTTMAEGDIEYTHTDAFIDKACEYILTHIPDMHTLGVSAKMDELIIEDFKEYLRGE